MNPFDLPGREFLGFYVALMALTALVLIVARRVVESGPVPQLPFVDPYLIAYLRGGAEEAVRICAWSLLDRGLLAVDGDALKAQRGAEQQVRRPLERALIDATRSSRTAYLLIKDEPVRASTQGLHDGLVELGLVPSDADKLRRTMMGAGAVAMLWAVAGIKMAIAVARGRHNIAFLVLLALASVVLVMLLLRAGRRTARGDRLLADLRTLFAGLHARRAQLRPGGSTQELALLTAVFGMSAMVEHSQVTLYQQLFPRAAKGGSSSGSGSSCGSSCSSSSDSSSGSSCSSSSSSCSGGSSCGGGGGCGGCGS